MGRTWIHGLPTGLERPWVVRAFEYTLPGVVDGLPVDRLSITHRSPDGTRLIGCGWFMGRRWV